MKNTSKTIILKLRSFRLKYFITLLVSIIIFLFTTLKFSSNDMFSGVAILILSAILSPLGFLLFLYFLATNDRQKMWSLIIISTSLFVGIFAGIRLKVWNDAMYQENIRKIDFEHGDEIIVAVKAFENETGFFPEHLESLVPKYLPFIPKTVDGKEFGYTSRKITIKCETEFTNQKKFTDPQCYEGESSFHLILPHSNQDSQWDYSLKYSPLTNKYSEYDWQYHDFL